MHRHPAYTTTHTCAHLCIGQLEQQAVLQLLQRDVVLVELADQVSSLLLQVRALVVDHQGQQLVLKTLYVCVCVCVCLCVCVCVCVCV